MRATPTLSGNPACSRTARRSRAATSPASAAACGTSRNASSIDPGSTTAEKRSKISNTSRPAATYDSNEVLTTTAAGHSRRARAVGMPLRTPYARAS